jgi:ATP-dependent DNA helicase RecQ
LPDQKQLLLTSKLLHQPLEVLQKYWGYPAFRPLQEEIIQSALQDQDTLALLPTGGGKSVCYQVPALCRSGITLVISPLIALMKDQVQQLNKRGIAAAALYSGLSYQDMDRILDNAVYGNLKLLYLSPERLASELARERIKKMHVNLIAVDEAHCISQWGYDFRPAYLNIAEIREWLPDTPVLALTATATPEVAQDIQERLNFGSKGQLFQKSFVRENLSYVVFREEGKLPKLLGMLQKVPGTALVYVRNRRRTQEIALDLQRRGISADFYHAGVDSETRSAKQDAWTTNKTRVMVSTNAFGMGIDKPDVRLVVHMDLPDSPEAYFQEAGRAGRDGERAYAVLLFDEADLQKLRKSTETSFPDTTTIRRVYQALGSYYQLAIGGGMHQSFDFHLVEFCRRFDLPVLSALAALRILEQGEWLVLTDSVFVPSKFHILVSPESLYDYQLKHPKLDKVLKALLRSHAGAFHHAVNLRERSLARFLNMEEVALVKALEHLHRDGIITYEPRKDAPQLLFTKDRVEARNLTIDGQLLKFRKERQLERTQAMESYVTTPVCRSQQLVLYFGETGARPCGICDVCLGRTKAPSGKSDLKDQLLELIGEEGMAPEELTTHFSTLASTQLASMLDYLVDEGYLEERAGRLFKVR